jgi:hypothetical protein
VLLVIAVMVGVQMASLGKAWASTGDPTLAPCSTSSAPKTTCCCSGSMDDAVASDGSCCSEPEPVAVDEGQCCLHETEPRIGLDAGHDTCCSGHATQASVSHGCPCASSAPSNAPAVPSFPSTTSSQRPIVLALLRLPAVLAISIAKAQQEPSVASFIEHDLSVTTLEPGHDRLCSWQV